MWVDLSGSTGKVAGPKAQNCSELSKQIPSHHRRVSHVFEPDGRLLLPASRLPFEKKTHTLGILFSSQKSSHRLNCSSFSGLPYRILYILSINHKKELPKEPLSNNMFPCSVTDLHVADPEGCAPCHPVSQIASDRFGSGFRFREFYGSSESQEVPYVEVLIIRTLGLRVLY